MENSPMKSGRDWLDGHQSKSCTPYAYHSFSRPFQTPPLPAYFISRPEVTDTLKARLLTGTSAASRLRPITVIHGPDGMGKSILAADLTCDPDIQRYFKDGILWITLGQRPDLLAILSDCIQILDDFDFRPTTIEAASTYLHNLLQYRVILWVLDDMWDVADIYPFPIAGPKSHALITTHRTDTVEEINAALHSLAGLTPEQALTLLASCLDRPLTENERPEALALVRTAGYLPLALELIAPCLAKGVPWADLHQALEAEIVHLEGLTNPRRPSDERPFVEAACNLNLDALRKENESSWQAFAWLGVLPENGLIVAPMAATLWEMDETGTVKMLEFLEHHALLSSASSLLVGEREWPAYGLHKLVHDLARRLLTTPPPQGLGLELPLAHAMLLNRYQKQIQSKGWHTLSDDSYIHSHLSWHMEQAGQIHEIHDLLQELTVEGRNGWYETRERLGQTTDYLQDVNRAMRLAAMESSNRLSSTSIGLQGRYALIIASLNSRTRNIDPAFLVLLVEEKILTPRQGLAFARQLPWSVDRAKALIGFTPHLPEVWLAEALAFTRTIRSPEYRAGLLIELATYLPANLFPAAIAIAQTITRTTNRAKTLIELAVHLPQAEQDKVMRQALECIQTIRSQESRAETLIELAVHLPQAEQDKVMRQALEYIQTLEDQEGQARMLIELASNLPETERDIILQQALNAVQTIENERYRAVLLTQMGPYLRAGLMSETLSTAYALKSKEDRVLALAGLAPYLIKGEQNIVLEQALAIAQTIEGEMNRALALVNLAPHLPEAELLSVLEEVLRVAQTTGGPPEDHVRLLAELVLLLPEALLPSALAAIQTIMDKDFRAYPLTQAALRLAKLGQIEQALTRVWTIANVKSWTYALAELVPYLTETERASMLRAVLTTVQGIRDEQVLLDALVKLAPYVSELMIRKILAKVQTSEGGRSRLDRLIQLTPYLPEDEEPVVLQEMLTIAQEIEEPQQHLEAMAGLVPLLWQTLQKKKLIKGPAIKVDGSETVAPAQLPLQVVMKKLREALIIEHDLGRAEELAQLIPQLVNLPREQLVPLWSEALSHLAGRNRTALLGDLLILVPVMVKLGGTGAIVEIYEAIDHVGQWWR